MGSIHLHSRALLIIAKKAVMRARAENSESAAVLPTDAIVAIVMSAAATEAFINEFAELAPRLYDLIDTPDPSLDSCVKVLQDLEKAHKPVATKYIEGARALAGKSFDKGALLYQSFQMLTELRNAIMHIHASFVDAEHSGQQLADELSKRGLALTQTAAGGLDWFDRLMTPAVAEWAHDAALKMIRAFLALVPVPAGYDPLGEHRKSFQDYPAVL